MVLRLFTVCHSSFNYDLHLTAEIMARAYLFVNVCQRYKTQFFKLVGFFI